MPEADIGAMEFPETGRLRIASELNTAMIESFRADWREKFGTSIGTVA
jgi:hypothetical protein